MAEKPQAAGDLGPHRLKRLLRTARYVDARVGIEADKEEDALLWDLVAEVARVTGVPAPARLVLSPYAEVSVGKAEDGSLALFIGVPLALAMPTAELKAVVAHALAVLREPDPELADALVRARAVAQGIVELALPDSRLTRLHRRVLEETAGFHDDIERYADRAAAAAAGSREQALTAMVRAEAIAEHFTDYAWCYLIQDVDPVPLSDLFTEWMRIAAQPVPDWAVDAVPLPALANRSAYHPGLRSSGDSLRRARQAASPLIPASGEPLISGLADDVSDALASFIDIDIDDPDADFTIGYAEAGQAVLTAAATLLGHDTATPADVVGLVEDGRGTALATAWHKRMLDHLEAGLPSGFIAERMLRAGSAPASTLGEALQVFLIAIAADHGNDFDVVLHPGASPHPRAAACATSRSSATVSGCSGSPSRSA